MAVKRGTMKLAAGEITEADIKRWAAETGLPWDDAFGKRWLSLWASDERVDRDGDIIRQDWNCDEFSKNPVILWAHNWHEQPIGNAVRWVIEERKEADYEGPALKIVAVFPTEETSPMADSIFRLAKSGFLRSGSVGFFPGEIVEIEDEAERQRLGVTGYIMRKNKLVEHSLCTVPANPGAQVELAKAKALGLARPGDIVALMEGARLEAGADEALWRKIVDGIRKLWVGSFPEVAIKDRPFGEAFQPDDWTKLYRTPVIPRFNSKALSTEEVTRILEHAVVVTREEVLKPFANEHSCRMADPDRFSEFRRGNGDQESDGKRIDVIYGHVRDSEDWEVQALRYPVDVWTEASAESHCTEREGIGFEPASGEEESRTLSELAETIKASNVVLTAVTEGQAAILREIQEIRNILADRQSDDDATAREAARAAARAAEDEAAAIDAALARLPAIEERLNGRAVPKAGG